MIKRGMNIHWTNQGGPIQMHYSASLFSRDRRRILDTVSSDTLHGLKRGVRETWGGLKPGRLILVSRHLINMPVLSKTALSRRKQRIAKAYIRCPNSRRARRLWPAF